jgi:cytochrome c-type biogenesis protein CcmH
MLWMILTLMTVLAAVGLAVPLVRRHDARRAERLDTLAVLKGQLGELEAQAEAGAIGAAEAEPLKSDLKRRLLAEGRAPQAQVKPLNERLLLPLGLGVVAIVTVGATTLYLNVGRPEVASAPAAGRAAQAQPADGHPQGEVPAMIAQLESRLQQEPGNAEGWRMLGWSYLQTGRNAEAAQAFGRAAAIEPSNADYLSAQGEATVLAAEGSVTPAAEALFNRTLALNSQDPRARYFLAVAKDQRGDHKGAMDGWIALLRDAPPDAPWAAEVREFVERIAKERNLDIAGRLPPATAMASAPARGPTAEQMAQAQDMSAGDRQQMIEGMVAGLAQRLKDNPQDRAGWEQLMRSRMVLGQTREAQAAYRDATRAFARSPGDQQALRQTAASLGIPGA